jgi:hypothetical protein
VQKGGPVIFRHNEIRDEVVNMAGKALTSSAVRDAEPLIKSGCIKESEKDARANQEHWSGETEQKATAGDDERVVDLLILGFWARGTNCMLDAHITDADNKSCSKRDPAKAAELQEKEKK